MQQTDKERDGEKDNRTCSNKQRDIETYTGRGKDIEKGRRRDRSKDRDMEIDSSIREALIRVTGESFDTSPV